MSVIVKGMEMPKNCWECSLSDIDDDFGRCCLYSGIACLTIGRQDNCPLVEIPTPHGQLIDADELIDGCEKLMRMLDPEGKEYLRVFAIKSYLMWAAEYAVIEEEGSKNE